MIRVTIELVPHGIERDAKKIGEMRIWNNGKGDFVNGRYDAVITGDKEVYQINEETINVKHKRTDNVFILIYKVLTNIVY